MHISAIIPARGGSKGIPRKNITEFCGKPLLAWSILQARSADMVDDIYVSSDDAMILSVAKRFGADVIQRPKKLANDTASSESALLHAIDWIRVKHRRMPDLIVFLQATSPLRESEDIDGAVRKLIHSRATSLFSMSLLEDPCIWRIENKKLRSINYDFQNRMCRQQRKPLYLENGSIYVFGPDTLARTGNRLGGTIEMYEMPSWKSFEIDTADDLELCEYFFKKHRLGKKYDVSDESMIRRQSGGFVH